ncbi:MAG TPA: lysophospholipid acyltransferase family protein [Cyclobacteriaceae bacterium]|nr:lysophospholipid acyltransferase family protein [Cyclobacteriaceae bacterium]
MTVFRRIYSTYGLVVFALTFIFLLPLFVITIKIPGLKRFGRKLNRLWSTIFFTLIFIRVKFVNRHYIQKDQQYIIVSNHFSYLDIPVLGFIKKDIVFVGKSSLGKIPLFGYMFRNLHIAVDRSSLKSRGESIMMTKRALDEGSSVVMFPEGGITSEAPPLMGRFKDSAFKIAIEKQIAVIPVTLSYNHLILPDDGRLLLRYGTARAVIHHPIRVDDKQKRSASELRDACFEIIQKQLLEDNGINGTENHQIQWK